MSNNIRIGIDLGGTKIEIIALNNSGKQVYKKRISTPQDDYLKTLNAIKDLVLQAESDLQKTASVGICTPGSLSPSTGLLRNSNSTCLNQKSFLKDISSLLKRDIRIANDANCFTLSEAIDGNAVNANIVFGVIIGTGCGGGIVINKTLIEGPNAICGEWGHNPLPGVQQAEFTQCWCGKANCIETYLSGPGLSNDYFLMTGNKTKAEDIIALASQGESSASTCLNRYELRLAKSLAVIINVLDPHAIILGGGMSNIRSLYENVPNLWQQYVFSDTVTTKLQAPKHGDSSGVRGAAWLWNS